MAVYHLYIVSRYHRESAKASDSACETSASDFTGLPSQLHNANVYTMFFSYLRLNLGETASELIR